MSQYSINILSPDSIQLILPSELFQLASYGSKILFPTQYFLFHVILHFFIYNNEKKRMKKRRREIKIYIIFQL